MNKTLMNIAAVERETGLGKDTLRVWERRYGFPRPERDQHGERAYTLDEAGMAVSSSVSADGIPGLMPAPAGHAIR